MGLKGKFKMAVNDAAIIPADNLRILAGILFKPVALKL